MVKETAAKHTVAPNQFLLNLGRALVCLYLCDTLSRPTHTSLLSLLLAGGARATEVEVEEEEVELRKFESESDSPTQAVRAQVNSPSGTLCQPCQALSGPVKKDRVC
jgi:hypothetical protein